MSKLYYRDSLLLFREPYHKIFLLQMIRGKLMTFKGDGARHTFEGFCCKFDDFLGNNGSHIKASLNTYAAYNTLKIVMNNSQARVSFFKNIQPLQSKLFCYNDCSIIMTDDGFSIR